MVTLRPVGRKVIQHGFFRDGDLDFQARGALGRAVRGSSEVGEVLATIARIRNQDGWAREWAVTARQVEAEADQARDAGHLVSASSGYLRAATYWASVVTEDSRPRRNRLLIWTRTTHGETPLSRPTAAA